MDADGERERRLTRSPASDSWPAWSPDGRSIAFMSARAGNEEIYVTSPDGGSLRRITHSPRTVDSFPAWLPDGRLSFTRAAPGAERATLWIVRRDGSRPRPFLKTVTGYHAWSRR